MLRFSGFVMLTLSYHSISAIEEVTVATGVPLMLHRQINSPIEPLLFPLLIKYIKYRGGGGVTSPEVNSQPNPLNTDGPLTRDTTLEMCIDWEIYEGI